MLNVAALIETLTPAALAAELGMSAQGVSNMKQRDAIPPRHWPAVVALAHRTPGLEAFQFSDLVTLHKPKPSMRQRESGKAIPARKRNDWQNGGVA